MPEASFSQFCTKTLPCLLISLVLFVGGIALIALRVAGWSLILGLPAIQIGIILLIFTFDEVARNKVGPGSLHLVPCSACGKPTLAPHWQKEKTCNECRQKKITKKQKSEKN